MILTSHALLRWSGLWVSIVAFLHIFSHCTATADSSQDQARLQDAEYISEVRESTIVIAAANASDAGTPKVPRPCRAWEIEQEFQSLSKRLQRPRKTENYHASHIRYRLLSAIDGYQKYGERALAGIEHKREMFKGLNAEQEKLINKVASYPNKLASAIEGIKINAKIANEIAEFAMDYYVVDRSEVDAHVSMLAKEGGTSDHTSVSQGLKHFVRDWSEDGKEERDHVFPQILETLKETFSGRSDEKPISVLVPGSGVGRLAHAVDGLGGFAVTSNEYSAYMNLAYRYVAQLSSSNSKSFSPYTDSWSHQPRTSELLRRVSFPDVPATPSRVLHVEGDFTTVFHHHHHNHRTSRQQYDVIITLFFIDTARNLLTYFQTIKELLKPDGRWINLGPLLYGSRPMVELSLDEIVKLVEEMGFVFVETGERWGELTLKEERGTVRGSEARYGLNPRALTRNAYLAQFWVCRNLQ